MGTPILVGMDVNVNPLSAVIAQMQGNNLCILDEMVLHDSDTRQMCQALRTRYPTREITICPDQTGS